ncbi:glycosyltransferase [Thiococcus pfennigii]|jgi:glycosyltransferase involved in cell wall biosynthesis|uniref:glycosyltransferase n=1 Tax=Thiococcus pfennigii TaxID=1057 RepID=UPI001907BC11|nr:glycosyltransferase [Thiococcus pfennigii]MBK1699456.1 glycosyl transferase family 1 [Thiococcus pfennigii]MBK1730263.1 glycosyl transferase family 1 [Thiococcus pfennigii]
MRVLMISDVYFPRVNGVSTSIQTFAHELVAKGHELTLIAPDYGRSAAAEPFEIIRIPSRYLPIDPEDRILRTRALRHYHRALLARGYDLVHIQTPFIAHYAGLGLARRLGVPAVASYHTFFEQYFDKYVTFLPSAWLRFITRRFSTSQCNDVDGLVVPSRAMLEVLRGYGVTIPAQVIPTGIQLERFRRGDGAAFRTRHGIAPERPVLVHVGRIAHEKNVEFLLRMLVAVKAEMPDVLLVIAGGGPARRSLEALAAQLGIAEQVRFVGYLDRGGPLEDCYSAGDVFVFASRTETQGLVVLEALALGLPVVSTAVMGTREVLVDGRGSLIAEEDEADFAAKAVRLLRDPGLRAELAQAGTAYAAEWSAPVLAERMLAFYRKVMERRRDAQLVPITADEPKA